MGRGLVASLALFALVLTTSPAGAQSGGAAYLTTFWDEEGALEIHGRLAPEDAAVFLRALDAARDSLWERDAREEGGSAEPRPRPTSADDGSAAALDARPRVGEGLFGLR